MCCPTCSSAILNSVAVLDSVEFSIVAAWIPPPLASFGRNLSFGEEGKMKIHVSSFLRGVFTALASFNQLVVLNYQFLHWHLDAGKLYYYFIPFPC